ncbi:MAG: hypothetical protein KDI88_12825 [Gammaproteobacteria bacterium]|nr:hypothetical protein [Gammaproteobacteria bacterium]
MAEKSRYSAFVGILRVLWLGLRKGRSMQDIPMWGLLQLSLPIPLLLVAVGLFVENGYARYILSSPVFWAIIVSGAMALLWRLYFLATRVGCIRQMNISEDGNPAQCLVDLGHRDCCKHIGKAGDKTTCRYWKPELIVD